MHVESLHIGLAMMILGLILSVTGMVSFTEILDLGVPVWVMVLGDLMVIASMAYFYLEFRKYEPLVDEYNKLEDIHKKLSSVPDDDYLVDLVGNEDEELDPLTLEPVNQSDVPELIDLTK